MKPRPPVRRQVFVFTPEEKKAIACVLAAFVLGLVTQHYRATHPHPAPPPTAKELRAAKSTKRSAAGRERSNRRAGPIASPTAAPNDSDD